jgi:hypothetical protein
MSEEAPSFCGQKMLCSDAFPSEALSALKEALASPPVITLASTLQREGRLDLESILLQHDVGSRPAVSEAQAGLLSVMRRAVLAARVRRMAALDSEENGAVAGGFTPSENESLRKCLRQVVAAMNLDQRSKQKLASTLRPPVYDVPGISPDTDVLQRDVSAVLRVRLVLLQLLGEMEEQEKQREGRPIGNSRDCSQNHNTTQASLTALILPLLYLCETAGLELPTRQCYQFICGCRRMVVEAMESCHPGLGWRRGIERLTGSTIPPDPPGSDFAGHVGEHDDWEEPSPAFPPPSPHPYPLGARVTNCNVSPQINTVQQAIVCDDKICSWDHVAKEKVAGMTIKRRAEERNKNARKKAAERVREHRAKLKARLALQDVQS